MLKAPSFTFGIFLLLFLIGMLFLSWGVGIGVRVFDEGNFVYGAACILRGELPYRDFFTIYFPGQFYALALVFKIFGESLIAERFFSITIHSLIASASFLVAKRLGNLFVALLSWFLVLLWFAAFGFLYFSTPGPPAIMFALFSCLFFLQFLSSFRRSSLFVSGILAGMSALFKQDIGLYLMLSETAVALPFLYSQTRGELSDNSLLRKLTVLLVYPLGAFLLLGPVSLFFLLQVDARELIFDLITWPLFIWPKYGSLPYPPPLENPFLVLTDQRQLGPYLLTGLMRVPYYFPIVLFIVAFLSLVSRVYRKQKLPWKTLLVFVLGLTCFHLAWGRSDIAHLYPTTVAAAILVSPLLSEAAANGRLRVSRLLVGLFSLLMLSSLCLYFIKAIPLPKNFLKSPDLMRTRGIYLPPQSAKTFEEAVRYILDQSREDQRIFVSNVRHDRGGINDIMFYFVAGRLSATKYFALAPGLVTTEWVQRKMIEDLARHKVDLIVVWTGSEKYLDAEENHEGGSNLLDNYIRSRYLPVRRFGEYLILRNRQMININRTMQPPEKAGE